MLQNLWSKDFCIFSNKEYAIIEALSLLGKSSKSGVKKLLGESARTATIHALFNSLLHKKMIQEAGLDTSSQGRPAMLYELTTEGIVYLSITSVIVKRIQQDLPK